MQKKENNIGMIRLPPPLLLLTQYYLVSTFWVVFSEICEKVFIAGGLDSRLKSDLHN